MAESAKAAANRAMGVEVRVLRVRKGWSRDELARRSGITVGQLERIENNKRDFNITQFFDVAYALGADPAEIIRNAVDNNGGLEALVQEARVSVGEGNNVTPLKRVEDLDLSDLEDEQYAANRDKEAETDEQFD